MKEITGRSSGAQVHAHQLYVPLVICDFVRLCMIRPRTHCTICIVIEIALLQITVSCPLL